MKKFLTAFIIFIAILVFMCGCAGDTIETSAPVQEQPKYIDLVACGDNLYHMPVINSGKKQDGTYDYSPIYEKLQPMIKNADISVIGQETVFAGSELGYSGYPLFNSPEDVGNTLAKEGFDVVLHASNHVLDKWDTGVVRTIEFWKKYPDIAVLGIHESPEDDERVYVTRINGANIAMLNYTYSTNGLPLPKDKPYLVELIDEDKIYKDALYAEENSDFTIAFIHWGTEYATSPNQMQKDLTYKMADWGVDLIIGSHPHVIQPVEYITTEKGNEILVYYSLGNFVSRQLEAKNLLGGIAKVKLMFYDNKVSINKHSFMPIVTHYNTSYNSFAVYPLKEYTNDIAAGHGVSYHDGVVTKERFDNMVNAIFEGYDKSIIDN
ncbi:MAG: CapA family protein [Eubacteriales bacterium]|nr:CapA family protein [Eubacteriales bacterium]